MSQPTATLVAPQRHDAFGLQLDTHLAGASPDARVRRGTANTFRMMRSGRIIHPDAFNDWLAASGDKTVPLLARHGQVGGGFAVIGSAKVAKGKGGLTFEATFAEGTELAEEAWTLAAQGHLHAVSIGWSCAQARWVTSKDTDLDPHFAREMKRTGRSECFAMLTGELLEVSLVEIGDDAGAHLTAALEEPLAAAMNAIDLRLHKIETQLAALAVDASGALTPTMTARFDAATIELRKLFEAAMKDFFGSARDDLIEHSRDLLIDPSLAHAQLLADADAESANGESCGVHGPTPASAGADSSSAQATREALLKRLRSV